MLAEATTMTNAFKRCVLCVCCMGAEVDRNRVSQVVLAPLSCPHLPLNRFDPAGRGSATLDYSTFMQIVYASHA
jgi:hypothetical protein